VSRRVSELVLENHPAYAAELERVMELERCLQDANDICAAGRQCVECCRVFRRCNVFTLLVFLFVSLNKVTPKSFLWMTFVKFLGGVGLGQRQIDLFWVWSAFWPSSRILFVICLYMVRKIVLLYYCLLGVSTILLIIFSDEPDYDIVYRFNIAVWNIFLADGMCCNECPFSWSYYLCHQ